ncbi:hypothetical protein [Beduinella massiliensis]|uniref:hypothetical protein n=1 Tax=Beduinella massiliensis TaxID=1852363 RepID=UPI0031F98637
MSAYKTFDGGASLPFLGKDIKNSCFSSSLRRFYKLKRHGYWVSYGMSLSVKWQNGAQRTKGVMDSNMKL